jgi:hypothetical protein
MTELRKIWIEQCEAAKGIEDEFGTLKALTLASLTPPSSPSVW